MNGELREELVAFLTDEFEGGVFDEDTTEVNVALYELDIEVLETEENVFGVLPMSLEAVDSVEETTHFLGEHLSELVKDLNYAINGLSDIEGVEATPILEELLTATEDFQENIEFFKSNKEELDNELAKEMRANVDTKYKVTGKADYDIAKIDDSICYNDSFEATVTYRNEIGFTKGFQLDTLRVDEI